MARLYVVHHTTTDPEGAPVGKYLLRRLLNYVVLLFIAVSLAWLLAQTQLEPRMLYEQRNPPLSPQSIDALLRRANVSETQPLIQRYLTWLVGDAEHPQFGVLTQFRRTMTLPPSRPTSCT